MSDEVELTKRVDELVDENSKLATENESLKAQLADAEESADSLQGELDSANNLIRMQTDSQTDTYRGDNFRNQALAFAIQVRDIEDEPSDIITAAKVFYNFLKKDA